MKNFWFALCIAQVTCVDQVFGAEAGMPQLNTEFWSSQVLWLVLIFTSLYLIIWKIFLPKITYSIENRRSKLVNDLNETQKLKKSAEEKLKEYNDIIENSKNDAKKIIEDNNRKLDSDIAKKRKKFNDEIEKEILAAENEIKNFKKSSITNVNRIAAEISAEVIKQVIDTDVNKSNVAAIVNEIVKRKIDKQI